jgi:hypothetical protein
MAKVSEGAGKKYLFEVKVFSHPARFAAQRRPFRRFF